MENLKLYIQNSQLECLRTGVIKPTDVWKKNIIEMLVPVRVTQ
jgi:hypothetical protein